MSVQLFAMLGGVAVLSYLVAPRVRTVEGFFLGAGEDGRAPGIWTLVLSQVTTWIFARSLMNAAVLGYFYGLAGALAYAAYYASFLTGGLVIDRVRFAHGAGSLQSFLRARFGRLGSGAYNAVVAVRLLSEVFANLLVIGVIFGVAGTADYTTAILAVAGLTLGYSMLGGLRASLRTDVIQAGLLIAALIVLFAATAALPGFDVAAIVRSSPDPAGPGWVLLAVAAVQVWSYPVHDPVMMDRGFLADRATTRKSFVHAGWISALAILGFGVIGVHAGLNQLDGEALVATLTRLLGEPTMLAFNAALVLSAVSTLDSTFSSAAKLAVIDMGLGRVSPKAGRIAMALFALGGLAFLFTGSKDLFAAVAVSGTASMFLAPVVFFNVIGGREVARWAFAVAFVAALSAAGLYMLEAGGHLSIMEPLFGTAHKYAKLLVLCLGVLAVGNGAFWLGLKRS